MDCRTAESLINGYVKKELSLKELEAFLDHVKKCPSCYEELDTYFTVSTAIQHLDGEMGGTMDMNRLLQLDLKKRENYLRSRKIQNALAIFVIAAAVLGMTLFLTWAFLV